MLPKGQQKLTTFLDLVEEGLSSLYLFLEFTKIVWSPQNRSYIKKNTTFLLSYRVSLKPTWLLVSYVNSKNIYCMNKYLLHAGIYMKYCINKWIYNKYSLYIYIYEKYSMNIHCTFVSICWNFVLFDVYTNNWKILI